jgi:hypothetical protein
MLTLQVKANWPTNPPRLPGTAFASNPLHVVPDFLEVAVNDFAAEIVNRVGWPGERDLYRLDVRLPSIGPGETNLQLTGAYVPAAPYRILVR